MMADLIRTSMFCDVNDDKWFLDDSMCVDNDTTHQHDVFSDNFMEFMTRTTDYVDDVSLDANINNEQQQQSRQQTTTQIDNGIGNTICNSPVASPEVCQDFMSRISLASKVDYNTFTNVDPCDVFCNNYLLPIVVEEETTPMSNKDSKPEATVLRPPYSYAACAVAAIYLLGKESAKTNEIVDKLSSVFDDMKVCNKQSFRKQLCKTLKSSNIFEQIGRGIYRVRSGCIDRNVFQRQACVDTKRREKYADTIQEHLEIPTMFEHLGIELIRKEKVPRKRHRRVVSDLLKFRSSMKKQKLESADGVINDDLKMPHRPCFHEDSDNELSHIPRHNTCSESADPVIGNSNVRSDSRCSLQQPIDLQQSFQSVPVTHHTPPVVVPTPRYAVPSTPACVPLRCQEYHIPYVGTFHLVDMYYNGQIIHQLYR